MAKLRIKGQSTDFILIRDNAPDDSFNAKASFEFTFEMENLREGYLGETSDRTDSIFNVVTISAEVHMEDDAALLLADSLVAKAQRRAGAAGRIDIVANYIYDDGSALQIVLIDIAFGGIPVNTASRSDYVTMSFEGECSDYLLLPL